MSAIIRFLDSINHEHRNIEVSHKIFCPFHEDTRESAKVYPNTDTIHCFTCNRTWTLVSAFANYHKVSFKQARVTVKERFGGDYEYMPLTDITVLTEPTMQDVRLMQNAVERTLIRFKSPTKLKEAFNKIRNTRIEDIRAALDAYILINRHAHTIYKASSKN